MVLRKYSIELRSLKKQDLGRVLAWRNSDKVRTSMFFQERITAETHEKWFSSLDSSSHYFLMLQNNEPFGVVNVKGIDWDEQSGEAGVFVGNEKYRNTTAPVLGVLCLMDVFFQEFGLKTLRAQVLAENKDALAFNQSLGYEVTEKAGNRILMEVDAERYLQHRSKFTSLLSKMTKPNDGVFLSETERKLFFDA